VEGEGEGGCEGFDGDFFCVLVLRSIEDILWGGGEAVF
jgi:hypothetical protein